VISVALLIDELVKKDFSRVHNGTYKAIYMSLCLLLLKTEKR
jgi:hypothetical protein